MCSSDTEMCSSDTEMCSSDTEMCSLTFVSLKTLKKVHSHSVLFCFFKPVQHDLPLSRQDSKSRTFWEP